jgi:hypothetical protein
MILEPTLNFSYGQFFVYDRFVRFPGCIWTERHYAQGFARRESSVCIGTLLEYGLGEIRFQLQEYSPDEAFERVIAVPFRVITGSIVVAGPEELRPQRSITVPIGNYRLVAAQRVVGDEEEALNLFFEELKVPSSISEILKSDVSLRISGELLETAETA